MYLSNLSFYRNTPTSHFVASLVDDMVDLIKPLSPKNKNPSAVPSYVVTQLGILAIMRDEERSNALLNDKTFRKMMLAADSTECVLTILKGDEDACAWLFDQGWGSVFHLSTTRRKVLNRIIHGQKDRWSSDTNEPLARAQCNDWMRGWMAKYPDLFGLLKNPSLKDLQSASQHKRFRLHYHELENIVHVPEIIDAYRTSVSIFGVTEETHPSNIASQLRKEPALLHLVLQACQVTIPGSAQPDTSLDAHDLLDEELSL